MKQTTSNYKLNKPELSDPADITQLDYNWDTIDRELSKRNIKSYTSLEQLGLSDSNLSATDFKSNIIAIVTALGANSSAILTIANGTNLTDNNNLNKSVIAQINTDLKLAMPNTVEGWLYIDPNSYAYRPYFVTVMFDRGVSDKAVFSTIVNRNSNGDLVHPFVVGRDPKGFVSKGGDTMYGDLIINSYNTDYQSSIRDYNESTELRSEKTDGSGDYDALIMYNENKMSSIDQKLKFRVCKNGSSKDYAIYGEHNKPTPAEIGASAEGHKHSASDITSGTLSSDRLSKVPIGKGGTDATDVPTARANLGFITGGYDGTNNARTIEVGGTSNVLIVWGGGYKTIVTPSGSIGYGGTQAEDGICNSGEVTFENGVLRIKKSFDETWESHRLGSINKKSTYYRYQAL